MADNDDFDVQVEVSEDEISNSEDQVSVMVDEEIAKDSDKSEADESEAESSYNFEDFAGEGMVKIGEADREFEIVKAHFLVGMGSLKGQTTVVSVHKCLNAASFTMQARIESFRAFAEAMARKRGGDPNQRRAWYGASKDEICQIVSRGFARCAGPKPGEPSYGVGIYLEPANLSLYSAMSSVDDERGLRNVLLCRVILGSVEQVNPGSRQILPSSRNFDSGTDNLVVPKKYIIWGSYMNSHILPEYLISFKPPAGIDGLNLRPRRTPTSQWMSFPLLITSLTRHLPPATLELIVRGYNDFRVNLISRDQLIVKLRQLAGDDLLLRLMRESAMNPSALAPRN